jgi:hypothetical protein
VLAASLRGGAEPQIWVTHPARSFFQMELAVRTRGRSSPIVPAIRRTVERFALFVLGIFALIAAAVAAIRALRIDPMLALRS